MKSSILLSLFVCLFIYPLSAQLSLTGYLITNEGDSLKGTWTEYFEVNDLIRVVMETTSGAIFEGDINSIKEYGQEWAYLRRRFEVEIDSATRKNVFLKCLVRGEPSLYVYSESVGDDVFYIQKTGAELLELPQPLQGYEYKDIGKVKVMDYTYRKVMGTQFTKCITMYSEAMELEYREDRMIQIVIDYHRCARIRYHKFRPNKRSAPHLSLQGFGASIPNSLIMESIGGVGGGFTVSREYFNEQSVSVAFEFNYNHYYYRSEKYGQFGRMTINGLLKKRYYSGQGYVSIHGGMGLVGVGGDILRGIYPGGLGKFFAGVGIGRNILTNSKVELDVRAQYLGIDKGILYSYGLSFQIF